jgi:hypothetical protein
MVVTVLGVFSRVAGFFAAVDVFGGFGFARRDGALLGLGFGVDRHRNRRQKGFGFKLGRWGAARCFGHRLGRDWLFRLCGRRRLGGGRSLGVFGLDGNLVLDRGFVSG